jgi:hypothetical protein
MMRDEETFLPRALMPATELVDHWTVMDTGSVDSSMQTVRMLMQGIPGELHQFVWRSFGENYNELLARARGKSDWILLLDADMKPEIHHGLKRWLSDDPDPSVDAWMVEMVEAGTRWRLPLLLRGDQEWEMIGPTHQYLDVTDRRTRALTGLELHHLRPGGGADPAARFEENIRLLAPGVEAGDPRAVFYTAESLRFLGRKEEAVQLYKRRAEMDGFEEEAWYAAYRAAELDVDLEGLISAWRRRPWRHEPLSALARVVAGQPSEDVLFREPLGN